MTKDQTAIKARGEHIHFPVRRNGKVYSAKLSYCQGHGFDISVTAEDGRMNWSAARIEGEANIAPLIDALG